VNCRITYCNLKLLASQKCTKKVSRHMRKNKNHYKRSLFHCFSSNLYCTPLMLWCSTNKISDFLEFWITQTHTPDPRCDQLKTCQITSTCTNTAVCHDFRKFHVINCGEVLGKLSQVLRATFRHKCLLYKVQQSHYGPGQAQRAPAGWGSQISRQLAQQGGKVVTPMHQPPLPPRKYSWYSFVLEAKSTPGP
jgi:hypothetical protein